MGDPACWLAATCPDCGAVLDEDPGRTRAGHARPCPRCGAVPDLADRRDEGWQPRAPSRDRPADAGA